MENQVFNWFIQNGNVLIYKNEDIIVLQLDYENGESCLLTRSDNEDIIQLLTKIAKEIWENPDYERTPYTNQLYTKTDNGYCWNIDTTKLLIRYNEGDKATEIRTVGSKKLDIEINHITEIIQILEHLNR